MGTLLYLVPSVVLLALTQVQVTSSDSNVEGSENCSCGLSNVTLTMIDNGLQLLDPSAAALFASTIQVVLFLRHSDVERTLQTTQQTATQTASETESDHD